MTNDILIVDDERDIRELVSGILTDEGYETRTASNSELALNEIAKRCPALVILDIWLQGSKLDGMEILTLLREKMPDLPVIMISGHGNIETAITAITMGAYNYIEKPFKAEQLKLLTKQAIDQNKLKRENIELKQKIITDELIGNSSQLEKLRKLIKKTAPTNSRVLISGPTGTGKEIVARLLHKHSLRKNQPFIAVNSATLSPDTMEEVLFGSIKSGYVTAGLLEQAHTGTLYLDKVADMPIDTQSKLLRMIVEQKFIRVGGTQEVHIDVRIISSTSRNIIKYIDHGIFREDLYHRLNVVSIPISPLNERKEDIGMLVEYYMKKISATSGLMPRKIEKDAMSLLYSHNWPGNVRQLKNCIEHMLILANGKTSTHITSDMLQNDILSATKLSIENDSKTHIMTLPLREAREIFEKEYLLAQTNRFSGNISRTAEFIGMERSALHRKLKSLGLNSTKNFKAVE